MSVLSPVTITSGLRQIASSRRERARNPGRASRRNVLRVGDAEHLIDECLWARGPERIRTGPRPAPFAMASSRDSDLTALIALSILPATCLGGLGPGGDLADGADVPRDLGRGSWGQSRTPSARASPASESRTELSVACASTRSGFSATTASALTVMSPIFGLLFAAAG